MVLLSRRQAQPRRPVLGVDTAEEAVAVTPAAVGSADLDCAAGLLGAVPGEIRRAVGGAHLRNARRRNHLQARAEYLSGNVRETLDVAKAAEPVSGPAGYIGAATGKA